MTADARRHPAGLANFAGDCTHLVGEVRGPRTYGGLLVAVRATYEPAVDATRVEYATVTHADYGLVVETGVARLDLGPLCSSPYHEGGEWSDGDPVVVEPVNDWRTP